MSFNRTRTGLLLIVLIIVGGVAAAPRPDFGPSSARQDGPEVYAEALGQANLRVGPGVEYQPVGQIVAGTRYQVLARHTRVPWLRLNFPGAEQAWVYLDLVTVTGDLALVPGVDDFPPLYTLTPGASTPTGALTGTPVGTPTATTTPAATLPGLSSPTPSATFTPEQEITGPVAVTLGEANLRFGPDVSYPVVAKVPEGQRLRIVQTHTQVPWVCVAYADSPTGNAWVFTDVVQIEGDLTGLPSTNAIQFSYPTLTPTPQTVLVPGAPWDDAPVAAGQLASTLGNAMHTYLLGQGFEPFGERMASVFVLDLNSGDTFTLNGDVAFSGMSLTKIPILVAYFQRFHGGLTSDEAFDIADTMMCSENLTTNALLARLGNGDTQRGAAQVTAFMQSLGLRSTFILREYTTVPGQTPVGTGTIATGVDQTRALPDAYNQVVPSDLGWLLAGVYQCAEEGTGLLVETYPDDFDPQVCRKMLYAMDANTINVFLEAGVPAGTRVIHKHGWIADTHGDAGIVIGPESAFVFVAVLYGRDWLEFENSAPVIGELARMTWNMLNPSNQVAAVSAGTVPAECDPGSSSVIGALLSESMPMIGP